MILDLIDHKRPNARTGIPCTEGVDNLGRILDLTVGGHMAAKGHPVPRRAKGKTIAVAGQGAIRIR